MARAGGVGTITVDYVMDRVVGQHLMVIDGTGVIGTGSYVVTAVTANTVSFASPGVDGSASPGSNTWFVCNEALTVNGLPQNDNLYALGGYWAVRRLVQAAERCRVIVGDAAMRTRFRPILEGQGVEPSAGENELQNAKTIVEGMGFTWANQKHVYGIAGAPYADVGELPDIYCNSGDTCPVKTEAEYLSAFLNRMNQLRYQYLFQQRSGNAAKFGVKQLCYEGGPSNVFNPGAANMNRRTAAKNTQAFADAHLQVLRDMARSGNDLYMHYASTQTLNHWGFTDDIKVVTPLWQSFRDYLTVPALAPQNVLTATGTTVIDGRSTLGTWETVFTNPALPGFATPTNNRARYQLYVDNDCTKTLTLNVASAGDSGVMHVDLMVNGIVVQANVALPVTGGFELSTFADLIFSPMVLKQGVCLLELIAKENHGAGNNEAFKRLTFS